MTSEVDRSSSRDERSHSTTQRDRDRRHIIFQSWMVIRSFRYAFEGVATLLMQRNAVVHVILTVIAVIMGVLLRISAGEWLAIVLAIALVLALEAINTAIESIVDLVSPQVHPLAKRAKDVGAGAVLIGAFGAAAVGLIVFLPRLWAIALDWLR